MKAEVDIKRDIIEVGRMLHSKGYIAATDGNISVRVSPNRILTTASGVSKGFLRDEHIVVVDGDGNLISGRHKPSSELKMHLIAYNLRPELKAIVHGHPPTCTAFTIAGISLAKCVLPEVVMTLGVIPTADYATPTTGEVPESIREMILKYDAVLLDRHGAITVSGSDVFDAYYKLEKIEHTAEVTLKARQLGQVKTLSDEQIDKLADLSGIDRDKLCAGTCVNCGACGQRSVAADREGAVSTVENSASSDGSPQSNEVLLQRDVASHREGAVSTVEGSVSSDGSRQSGGALVLSDASQDCDSVVVGKNISGLEARVKAEVIAEIKKLVNL